jgi:hypothetical protein
MTSTSATRLLRTARRKLLHDGALVAVAVAASVAGAGWGEARAAGADQDRLQHGAHRRPRRRRQARADRDGDLARRRQCGGRAARPAGRVRLLRRSDPARERAEDLHQASDRRPGRPRRVGLRHQPDRAGDADRHAQRHGVHEPFIKLATDHGLRTIALVGADAEFSQNALEGARTNAQAAGLEIVYDESYPPNTADFTPIVRAIQATNPDVSRSS